MTCSPGRRPRSCPCTSSRALVLVHLGSVLLDHLLGLGVDGAVLGVLGLGLEADDRLGPGLAPVRNVALVVQVLGLWKVSSCDALCIRWLLVGACSAAHASLGVESPSHATSLAFVRPVH